MELQHLSCCHLLRQCYGINSVIDTIVVGSAVEGCQVKRKHSIVSIISKGCALVTFLQEAETHFSAAHGEFA